MLFVPPYFRWCKLIQLYQLKSCRAQWRIGLASKHRIGKYGSSSKRLLLGFLAIGKSHTMNFQDGCKIFKHLCQVQFSNYQLYHTIWKTLLTIALWYSTSYSRLIHHALKSSNTANNPFKWMVRICTASMVGHGWWQLPKMVTQIFCPLHLPWWRGDNKSVVIFLN